VSVFDVIARLRTLLNRGQALTEIPTPRAKATSGAQTHHDEGALDPAAFLRLRGIEQADGERLVRELVDTFVEDSRQRIADLRRASVENDLHLLWHTAQTLKSACMDLGAVKLAALCERLADVAHRGTMAGSEPVLGEIEACHRATVQALHAECRGRGAQ
jgi:histidine phosphotransfer protein HptB